MGQAVEMGELAELAEVAGVAEERLQPQSGDFKKELKLSKLSIYQKLAAFQGTYDSDCQDE